MLKIKNTPLKLPIFISMCPVLLSLLLLGACSGQHSAMLSTDREPAHSSLKHLAALNWRLHSIKRQRERPSETLVSGIPAKRYQLDFIDNHLRLRGGCNAVNGAVKIPAPGKIQIGPMVMTNRGCNTRLMQADIELSRTLVGATNYRLDQDQLAVLGAGRILVFNARPKTANQQGSAANVIQVRPAKFW